MPKHKNYVTTERKGLSKLHVFITFMNEYGYLVLFLALFLGILAVPLPIEAMMGYAGLLAFQGQMNWMAAILSAGLGGAAGMFAAYWVGYKLGMPFFEKYGPRIHLGPDRLEKTSSWFKKYGNKLLIIAFFIPGVRHMTGYFSGITRMPFRTYAVYSFTGSFIWVSTFILLGKLLGPKWAEYHDAILKYLLIAVILIAVIILSIYLFRRYKEQIIHGCTNAMEKVLETFRTRRRFKFFMITVSVVTLLFAIIMIGMIEDYVGNEFNDFDKVVSLLVAVIFKGQMDLLMSIFIGLGKNEWLIVMIIATLFWIIWKGRDKPLEIYFLFITVAGGELYEEMLRNTFHRLAPGEPSILDRFPYSFPSEQSLMAFVIYGFFFFILLRHSRNLKVHTFLIIGWTFLVLFLGIGRIYFASQVPSQIAAGYVFGVVWLGFSILLLELFRVLTSIEGVKKKSKMQ